jgi:predicted metal-binding protein
MQTEDYCPATTDFKIIRERSGVFSGIEEEIEIVGINSCGGCPGKRAPFG